MDALSEWLWVLVILRLWHGRSDSFLQIWLMEYVRGELNSSKGSLTESVFDFDDTRGESAGRIQGGSHFHGSFTMSWSIDLRSQKNRLMQMMKKL